MIAIVLEWLRPILEYGLEAVAAYVLIMVGKIVPTFVRAWIDRVRQEALHRAVKTAVGLIITAVSAGVARIPPLVALDIGLGYVMRTSPGILKWFFKKNTDAAQAHVIDLLKAELTERGYENIARDIDAARASGGEWAAPAIPSAPQPPLAGY